MLRISLVLAARGGARWGPGTAPGRSAVLGGFGGLSSNPRPAPGSDRSGDPRRQRWLRSAPMQCATVQSRAGSSGCDWRRTGTYRARRCRRSCAPWPSRPRRWRWRCTSLSRRWRFSRSGGRTCAASSTPGSGPPLARSSSSRRAVRSGCVAHPVRGRCRSPKRAGRCQRRPASPARCRMADRRRSDRQSRTPGSRLRSRSPPPGTAPR